MSPLEQIGLPDGQFAPLAGQYRRHWGIDLLACAPDGRIVGGAARRAGRGEEASPRSAATGRAGKTSADSTAARAARAHAIAEALRWGEPTVIEYPASRLAWAVPLMHNARVLGGLVAVVGEDRAFSPARAEGGESPGGASGSRLDIRRACEDLRQLAEQANVTNAELLAARRLEYQREQKRAEAIQDFKTRYFYSIRDVYLREEPALIAAVRQGDRQQARGILNRILAAIYYLGGDDLAVIKSFLMELVVTMCRTAVESGGEPQELLGANYAGLAELGAIDSEEQLSHWLVQMLERIMDAIQRRRAQPSSVLLHSAMRYLADHFDEEISRDDVARVAGLSPSHFSRLISRQIGRSFTDLLNQLRIDRAVELLRHTEKSLLQIALEVGYNDQSYFTKVFRRYMRMTPRQYRQKMTR